MTSAGSSTSLQSFSSANWRARFQSLAHAWMHRPSLWPASAFHIISALTGALVSGHKPMPAHCLSGAKPIDSKSMTSSPKQQVSRATGVPSAMCLRPSALILATEIANNIRQTGGQNRSPCLGRVRQYSAGNKPLWVVLYLQVICRGQIIGRKNP